MKILVGADPELFVRYKGELVSAFGLLPGTKKAPYKVDKGAVQVDGMAAEFNIDPAENPEQFLENLETVLNQLQHMLGGCTLHADPVAHFGADFIKAQPAAAKELGCDPDFNAWMDGAQNIKPNEDAPFRTGAGHVHIGVTDGADIADGDYLKVCCDAVKQMDFYLGLPSIFFDDDVKRRELYGSAGCFRPKSYGFEYRTLSNKWVGNKALMRWVFNNSQTAMKQFFAGHKLADKYGDIQKIINTSDKAEATRIIKDAGIIMP